jgi:hypothetical protein
MRLAVLLAVSVAASGCLAHTARERRQKGAVALAAGAALVFGGVLLAEEGAANENLLVAMPEAIGGSLMVIGGVGAAAVGSFNLLTGFGSDQPVTEHAPPPLDTTADRAAACATWRSNRRSEHDPARQAALDAARPAHCRAGAWR